MKVSVTAEKERDRRVGDEEVEVGHSGGDVVAGEVVRLPAVRPEYEAVDSDVTHFLLSCGCAWIIAFTVYYGIKAFGIIWAGGSDAAARSCQMDAFYGNQVLHFTAGIISPFGGAVLTVLLALVGIFIAAVRDHACPGRCDWLDSDNWDTKPLCGLEGASWLLLFYYPLVVYLTGFFVTTQFALNGPPQARPFSGDFFENPINCSEGIDGTVYSLSFYAQKADVFFHLVGAPVMLVIFIVRFVCIPFGGTAKVWFKRQKAGFWNWVTCTEDLDMETLVTGTPVEVASPLDDTVRIHSRKYRKCCCWP